MNAMELLTWARGSGMQIAVAVLLLGSLFRVSGILFLGRQTDLAEARGGTWIPGLRTVVRRSWTDRNTLKSSALTYAAGYTFHIGFLLTLLFYTPHILYFRGLLGFGWPALPTSLVDVLAVLSIAALVALLVNRVVDPVRRFLSGFQDYFTWLVTLLPLATGYMALNRLALPYTEMLSLHILSIELLLVTIPFTKLIHAVTFLIARWYNGAIAGRKGVRA
jgi:nitrate reductase gamma subunit